MATMNGYGVAVGPLKMSANSRQCSAVLKKQGYSLVELLIVVAILGIMVSIGYPAYTSHMASAARSAAQSDLMGIAAGMERHRAANFSYSGAASGGGNTGEPGFYNNWSPSTEPESSKQYNLSILSVTAAGTSYVLRAQPVSGSSTAGSGDLYYYSDGRKAWDKNADGTIAVAEYCWVC